MTTPKVTVFTPCYNHGRFLAQAIESVLAQTFQDFEYILIDDGSTDNSWDVMKAYARQDARIRVLHLPKQPNKGPVLNAGVSLAKGDYWVWVPADDYVATHLLEEKRRIAERYPNTVIYDDFDVVDEDGKYQCTRTAPKLSRKEFVKTVWKKSIFGFTGIWIPTPILRRLPWPTHVPYSEDYWWLLNAVKHGVDFRGIRKVLHTKRDHAGSVTQQNYEAVLAGAEDIRKELGNDS